jgi:hypothetical protein
MDFLKPNHCALNRQDCTAKQTDSPRMRPRTRLGNAVYEDSRSVIIGMCGFLIEGFGGLFPKMWRQYVPSRASPHHLLWTNPGAAAAPVL